MKTSIFSASLVEMRAFSGKERGAKQLSLEEVNRTERMNEWMNISASHTQALDLAHPDPESLFDYCENP